nr:ribonuclease H-like domain-containing protein [Tanacetum cinerariifolium]
MQNWKNITITAVMELMLLVLRFLLLGLQVKQKKDGIFISQDKYVAEILRKFGLSEGKSASTPIDADKPLLKDSDSEGVDVHTYSILGFDQTMQVAKSLIFL